MRRFLAFSVLLGIIAMAALAVRTTAQNGPPDGPPGGPGGPPRHAGRAGLRGRGGPDGEFHLVPPFAAAQMNLTKAQQKKLAKLEKDTKTKLYKILTPEQQKILEAALAPQARRGGRGGPGGLEARVVPAASPAPAARVVPAAMSAVRLVTVRAPATISRPRCGDPIHNRNLNRTRRVGCAKRDVSKTTDLSGFRSTGTPPPSEWRCSE